MGGSKVAMHLRTSPEGCMTSRRRISTCLTQIDVSALSRSAELPELPPVFNLPIEISGSGGGIWSTQRFLD